MSSTYYERRKQNLCVSCGVDTPEEGMVQCSSCRSLDKAKRQIKKISRALPALPPVPPKMDSVRTREILLVGSLKRGAIDPPERLDAATEVMISDYWKNQDIAQKQFRRCKIRGIMYRKVAIC